MEPGPLDRNCSHKGTLTAIAKPCSIKCLWLNNQLFQSLVLFQQCHFLYLSYCGPGVQMQLSWVLYPESLTSLQ